MKAMSSYFKEHLDKLNFVFLSVLLSATTINIKPQIGRKIFELVLSVAAAIIVAPAAGSMVGMIVNYRRDEK